MIKLAKNLYKRALAEPFFYPEAPSKALAEAIERAKQVMLGCMRREIAQRFGLPRSRIKEDSYKRKCPQ